MAAKKGWKGVNYVGEGSREKVEEAFNVTPMKDHLDGDYELKYSKQVRTTDQGLLMVAELKPKTSSLPSFSIRWDQKGDHLNVDIRGVGQKEEGWFRNGKKGYSGHVATKAIGQGRACYVDISIPSRHVFKGRFAFNLIHDLVLGGNITPTGALGVRKVK
jgi:hypothetical protein